MEMHSNRQILGSDVGYHETCTGGGGKGGGGRVSSSNSHDSATAVCPGVDTNILNDGVLDGVPSPHDPGLSPNDAVLIPQMPSRDAEMPS